MAEQHEPTYTFVKKRVVVTCSCGLVRRYENEMTARRAHGAHVAAKTRRPVKKED